MKKCSKCKEWKTKDKFSKNRSRYDGLQNVCNKCAAEYRKNHKEEIKEYHKAYDIINRTKIKERKQSYYKKNKDKILARNKEYYYNNIEETAEQCRKYRLGHLCNYRLYRTNRRSMKLHATPTYADLDKIKIFYITAQLLSELYNEKYHVDHIIPLKSKLVCGLHYEGNLQVITATENLRKGNRTSLLVGDSIIDVAKE